MDSFPLGGMVATLGSHTSNYCPLPFKAVFVDSMGVSPCCMIKRELTDLSCYPTAKIKQIQDDFLSDRQPDACRACFDNEKNYGRSIRTEAVRDYQQQFFSELSIDNVDFRSSNICNFKCRSCNTNFSHGINQEVAHTPSLERFFGQLQPSKTVTIDQKNREWILQNLGSIKRFMFTGGEPTVIPEVKSILEQVLDRGHPDVQILITSNCSFTDKFWQELTLTVQNLHWTASIDAVGTDAEHVRDGTHWPTVENNVRWLATHANSLDINTVISNLNILKLKPLLRLARELQLISRHPNGRHGDQGCRHQFVVSRESRLDAVNWPDDRRGTVIDYLEQCLEMDLDDEQAQTLVNLIEQIEIKAFNQADWDRAVESNRLIDQVRKQNYSCIMFEQAA